MFFLIIILRLNTLNDEDEILIESKLKEDLRNEIEKENY